MFIADYSKNDNTIILEILLLEEVIASYEAETIEEAAQIYTQFEENYFDFTFPEELKVLKTEDAKLNLALKENHTSQMVHDLMNLNIKIQELYNLTGFEKIRNEHEFEYKTNLANEVYNVGVI